MKVKRNLFRSARKEGTELIPFYDDSGTAFSLYGGLESISRWGKMPAVLGF
jgi:hypothetical protein